MLRGLPDLGRTAVMGVVNVTPDSFTESGRHFDADAAIAHGLALAASGADLVDVGGESTRPGAERIECVEELRRVLPVVTALSAEGVFVSIDTMRAEVAAAALDAGARLINDVSGGLADPALPRLVGEAGVPYIVMHWRGHSADMYAHATYDDVVREVCDELLMRIDAVVAAGVAPDDLLIDPGIGFAKKAEHNWALLGHLHRLIAIGPPVLVGASRKSFLGTLLADDAGPRDVARREDATVAITTLAAEAGAWGVRVHDARPSADAVRVVAATRAAG